MSNLLNLPPAVIAALIALVVAWLTSLITLRVEIRKLRVQLQQAYATKIVETRIATYPEIYSYTSGLSKQLETRVPSRVELEALREKVDSWDSKNAIFLGKDTVNICHKFRMVLNDVIGQAAEEPSPRGSTQPPWVLRLSRGKTALQLGLRSDLGLYGFKIKGSDIDVVWPEGWEKYHQEAHTQTENCPTPACAKEPRT